MSTVTIKVCFLKLFGFTIVRWCNRTSRYLRLSTAYTNGAKTRNVTNIQCALCNRSSLSFSILVPISILLPLALERESFSSKPLLYLLPLSIRVPKNLFNSICKKRVVTKFSRNHHFVNVRLLRQIFM